jgi:hypothetical protein
VVVVVVEVEVVGEMREERAQVGADLHFQQANLDSQAPN